MAMAPTTEQQSQRIDLGQRLFLLGIFAILVTEALATIVNIGVAFTWTGAVLGIVSAVVILYLGNRLYGGDKAALTATRAWVVLEIMLVLTAVAILLSETPAEATMPIAVHLNISAAWQGWLKLAAYLGFGAAVYYPGVVLEFLATQRGETVVNGTATAVETPATQGEPVTLEKDQVQALEGLSGAMKMAGGLLSLVGAFDLLAALFTLNNTSDVDLLNIVEGFAFLALGAVIPIFALQGLVSGTQRTMTHIMNYLSGLARALAAYVVLFFILAVVAIWRLFL
jgi:hypothetical protein